MQNSDLKVGITVVQIYKDWMFDLLRGDSDISVGIYFGAIENNRNRDIWMKVMNLMEFRVWILKVINNLSQHIKKLLKKEKPIVISWIKINPNSILLSDSLSLKEIKSINSLKACEHNFEFVLERNNSTARLTLLIWSILLCWWIKMNWIKTKSNGSMKVMDLFSVIFSNLTAISIHLLSFQSE